jgi:hypothetical protein
VTHDLFISYINLSGSRHRRAVHLVPEIPALRAVHVAEIDGGHVNHEGTAHVLENEQPELDNITPHQQCRVSVRAVSRVHCDC